MESFVDVEFKLPPTVQKTKVYRIVFMFRLPTLEAPEFKKGQILHLSAGVTLRLYSGNRVWKEVYSHKRAMFCNQIKRRILLGFLKFCFQTVFISNSPYQKQDTNLEVRALTATLKQQWLIPDFILSFCNTICYLPFGD